MDAAEETRAAGDARAGAVVRERGGMPRIASYLLQRGDSVCEIRSEDPGRFNLHSKPVGTFETFPVRRMCFCFLKKSKTRLCVGMRERETSSRILLHARAVLPSSRETGCDAMWIGLRVPSIVARDVRAPLFVGRRKKVVPKKIMERENCQKTRGEGAERGLWKDNFKISFTHRKI